MKPGPNVSIELLKSISTQKAHKTCHKQGSKLHYLGTNQPDAHNRPWARTIEVHARQGNSFFVVTDLDIR